MTHRELVQLERDARRPDYGGKYYKPDVVLALIDELKRAWLFVLILALNVAPRQGEPFAAPPESAAEGEDYVSR